MFFGVEVGLDTNARKNRGGENMSKAVSLIFDKAKIFYKRGSKQFRIPEITSLGADLKDSIFIKTKVKTYLIETIFIMAAVQNLMKLHARILMLLPK